MERGLQEGLRRQDSTAGERVQPVQQRCGIGRCAQPRHARRPQGDAPRRRAWLGLESEEVDRQRKGAGNRPRARCLLLERAPRQGRRRRLLPVPHLERWVQGGRRHLRLHVLWRQHVRPRIPEGRRRQVHEEEGPVHRDHRRPAGTFRLHLESGLVRAPRREGAGHRHEFVRRCEEPRHLRQQGQALRQPHGGRDAAQRYPAA